MRKLLFIVLLLSSTQIFAQDDESDFLPHVSIMAIDSTERVAQEFCKKVMAQVPGYSFAFVDKEDIYISKYVYDNTDFESVRFEFQFVIEEVMRADSTMAKQRVVKLQNITAELSAMTNIYNYIYNTTHNSDKLLAISRHEKAVSYNGTAYNSSLVADDYKPGYWILRFWKL